MITDYKKHMLYMIYSNMIGNRFTLDVEYHTCEKHIKSGSSYQKKERFESRDMSIGHGCSHIPLYCHKTSCTITGAYKL